jgi:hypothetical protein
VLFNGTNTDPQSQAIYQAWMKQHAGTDRITGSPTADKRAALVEHFLDNASIMIATEAAPPVARFWENRRRRNNARIGLYLTS